ncbi:MAG: 4Fe-4S dicluster domain-containing protein [Anaerolineales bacterium]|nr:4Fe-4S dicluster domain-containing protein [Anaerolineales bacterium]
MFDQSFVQQVNDVSEQTIELCYHCHKCTSGCPVAVEMEYGPDRLLRLIQMGEKERVLTSADVWICASCETCATRCPNEISIAEVMDALRKISVQEGYPTPERDAPAFHKLFLSNLNLFGRMHELSLLGLYKLKTMKLMADMDSGIPMLLKGKMPILPHRVKRMDEVKRILKETQK